MLITILITNFRNINNEMLRIEHMYLKNKKKNFSCEFKEFNPFVTMVSKRTRPGGHL